MFFFLIADVVLPSLGNPHAPNQIMVYFSPACEACHAFETSKKWRRYVEENKNIATLTYHPIYMPQHKDQQLRMLCILFKHFSFEKLQIIMKHYNLWLVSTDDNAEQLKRMLPKDYAQRYANIKDCVFLAALLAGYDETHIRSALIDEGLKNDLAYMLTLPLNTAQERIEDSVITNLPFFDINGTLINDPDNIGNVELKS